MFRTKFKFVSVPVRGQGASKVLQAPELSVGLAGRWDQRAPSALPHGALPSPALRLEYVQCP